VLLLLFLHNYLSHDFALGPIGWVYAPQPNIVNYFMGMGMANAMCSEYGNVGNIPPVSIGQNYHHNIKLSSKPK
jgi:hypothetical protein